MKNGLLIVVSGPSGTGKGTVCNALLRQIPSLAYSVSATTRLPRPGEKDGENYYFMSRPSFEELISQGGFLEYAEVFGNYYGTPLQKIEERRQAGQDILLEIDIQGAMKVMDKCPDGVFIFLLPPSLKELERRIRGRGTETEESIAHRLGKAKEEILTGKRYKYAVVNDEVAIAVKKIAAILTAEHCHVSQAENLFEELCR